VPGLLDQQVRVQVLHRPFLRQSRLERWPDRCQGRIKHCHLDEVDVYRAKIGLGALVQSGPCFVQKFALLSQLQSLCLELAQLHPERDD
jgi:hypothetical protein